MSFDPDLFVQTDVEGMGSTEYVAIPIDEYPAHIKAVQAKEVVGKNDGELYRFLEIGWVIDDPQVAELTGMKEPYAKQSFLLDLTEDDMLDMRKGRNVGINRLRAAVGQDDPTKPWNFQMLVGQTAKVLIKHRLDDQGQPWAEVKSVAKL